MKEVNLSIKKTYCDNNYIYFEIDNSNLFSKEIRDKILFSKKMSINEIGYTLNKEEKNAKR